jgi:serine/threonine-protein kinase
LKRCLDRDVKTRLRDVGEARIILQHALHGDLLMIGDAPSGPRAIAAPLGKLFWAVSAIAILSTVAFLWVWLRPRPLETKPVIRFSFAVPAFHSAMGLTLSRDGSMVAYQTGLSGPVSVRRIDQFEASPSPARKAP